MSSGGTYTVLKAQGPHPHILMLGGKTFLSQKLWPWDIVWRFFWLWKKTGICWVLYFLSAQINRNMITLHCLCGITRYFWFFLYNFVFEQSQNFNFPVNNYICQCKNMIFLSMLKIVGIFFVIQRPCINLDIFSWFWVYSEII